jgi:nucleotide-binding universal stress UspA family protein
MTLPANVKSILLAYEFDDVCPRVLPFARELARTLGATLTLLHVAEVKVYGPHKAPFPPPDVAEQLAATATEELKKLAGASSAAPATVLVRRGVAWEEIEREADPGRHQLLVIASHGRHGVARAMLGSVAEKVVRSAKIPVLVVPAAA